MSGYLRLATPEDMDLLFEWANDKEVRRNSFSMEPIVYENHKKWFAEILENEACEQYIYCVNDEPIGQVRISMDGDCAEIGYSICFKMRGKGHGKQMLKLLGVQIKKDFPQIHRVVARVKPENAASSKVFEELGYKAIYQQYEIKTDDL